MLLALFSKPWWKTDQKDDEASEDSSRSPSRRSESELAEMELDEEPTSPAELAPPRADTPPREELRADTGESDHVEPVVPDEGEHPPHDDEDDAVEVSGGAEAEDEIGRDDPLGPGFDLDHGEPIAPKHFPKSGGSLPWRTKIRSPKEFFGTEILYRFDILEKENRELMVGTYRLELKGSRGGVWTLTVGEDLGIVNRREDADVVISMQQSDFLRVINGELNPQLAMLAQKARVTGDVRKIVAFQSLLAPDNN